MYLSLDELSAIGFRFGSNPRISDKCSFYNLNATIGDDVRIDDFCILKGNITIGSHVHIAAYSMISGAWAPVEIGDFVSLAARVTVYSGSDYYGADALNNSEFSNIITGPVKIGLGAIIGAGSIILPNATIGDGASIGAHCIVNLDVPDGFIGKSPPMIAASRYRSAEVIKDLARRVLEGKAGEP